MEWPKSNVFRLLTLIFFVFGVDLAHGMFHNMFPPDTNVLDMILDNLKESLPIAPDEKRTISFHVYTRSNPRNPAALLADGTEVPGEGTSEPVLRRGTDTKILLHGFGASGKDAFAIQTKNALLRHDDVNVVVVDWGTLAKGTLLAYPLVMRRSKFVGKKIAELLVSLHRAEKLNPWNIHFIGLSLGSNIASMAARIVKNETGHVVQRITGLDPTFLYNFDCETCIGGVSKSDASFVDVLHTNTWFIGLARPVGHVDFYPNGGLLQPGCKILDNSLSIYHWLHCPHVRAWLFFLESINHPYDFMAWPCDSWEEFSDGNCSLNTPLSPMGYHASPLATGSYFLHTNADSPFGRFLDCSLPEEMD